MSGEPIPYCSISDLSPNPITMGELSGLGMWISPFFCWFLSSRTVKGDTWLSCFVTGWTRSNDKEQQQQDKVGICSLAYSYLDMMYLASLFNLLIWWSLLPICCWNFLAHSSVIEWSTSTSPERGFQEEPKSVLVAITHIIVHFWYMLLHIYLL